MDGHAILSMPCAEFVGAVCHHSYFTGSDAARERIAGFVARIGRWGASNFVDEEYPAGAEKRIILNIIDGKVCVTDGNAHLVALVAACPGFHLGQLWRSGSEGGLVRVWRCGWEDGSGQDVPYDTYVPLTADVSRIPGAHAGTDWFKQPPESINVIPSNVPYDSELFSAGDRGRTLGETVEALGL